MNLDLPRTTTADAATVWLRQLVRNFGLGFHLDTRPEDYVFPDGQRCLTPDECASLNNSLARLFAILGEAQPYVIAANELASLLSESRGWKPPLHYHDLLFQRWLVRNAPREDVIAWLCWNDPHGIYTDRDSLTENRPPLTLAEARQIMRDQVERDQVK